MILNERQALALESLRTYRYLTVKHMVKLGVHSNDKRVREKVLAPLKAGKHPLIKAEDFGFVAGKGRLSAIHYLTSRGALVLADYLATGVDDIPYPTGQVQFSRDYFHRIEFIDIHIALRQWAKSAGHGVEFFHSYYNSTGNQRQANSQLIRDTQIKLDNGETLVPDGNFLLDMADGQRRLFTLELHKGTNTARIIEQLEKPCQSHRGGANTREI